MPLKQDAPQADAASADAAGRGLPLRGLAGDPGGAAMVRGARASFPGDGTQPALRQQYARQYRWRAWPQAYEALPPLFGTRVLDLGCAIGDQALDLSARGAQVVGLDADAELVAYARSRNILDAVFETGDVRAPAVDAGFDGIWASFVPACFPALAPVLSRWRELLRPGGWIALTEVGGLFRHEPLAGSARSLLEAYAREAFEAGRYDFDMGDKLAGHLAAAGFEVRAQRVLPDRELSFGGPAKGDVLQAWVERLHRMPLLQARARSECPSLEDDLVRCLSSPQHASACRVHFCLAVRP